MPELFASWIRNVKPAILAAILVFSCGVTALGHGRNSTYISADVYPDKAVVEINAVIVDLLAVGGMDVTDWEALPSPSKAEVLHEASRVLASRFLVFERACRLQPAGTATATIPDFNIPRMRHARPDQQGVRIVLKYDFSAPPEELTFWQAFDGGRTEDAIHTQISIRQKGEMVLLPAELGTGFLLQFPFDWSSEPEPIAHRKHLGSAVCSWHNRPATARLEILPGQVAWTIRLPVERFANRWERSPGNSTWPQLEQDLKSATTLRIGEERAPVPGEKSVRSFPMSASALVHDSEVGPLKPAGILVEIKHAVDTGKSKNSIHASTTLFNENCPLVYVEIVEEGRLAQSSVLTPENPILTWSE